MTHEKQTPSDRLAVVESLLNSTHAKLRELDARVDKTLYVKGELYAYRMVLNAFAEAGFDIGDGKEVEGE